MILDTSGPNGQGRAVASGLDVGADVRLTPMAAPLPLFESPDSMAPCPSEFAWTSVDDAVYYLQLNSEGAGPSLTIASTSPHVTIPDLSALGLPTLSGDYTFWPNSLGGYESLDAYAANPGHDEWGMGPSQRCHFDEAR